MAESSGMSRVGVDEAYRPLPALYLCFLSLWLISAFVWTVNTYKNRHFQVQFLIPTNILFEVGCVFMGSFSITSIFGDRFVFANKLQWTLAAIPLIKALQLFLSFLFWYSCFYLKICSLWMSFGAYVTGVFFQTASFISFLLISHGYCIMCEQLSATEQRTTAALGCIFYLIFVGYKASVPYFSVLLLLNYFISFYTIFHHISQNLLLLREQLTFTADQDLNSMHDALFTKYMMFKKFQGAMQIIVMAETVMYLNIDSSTGHYWFRLLVREWAQFCIFFYIAWTFRSQDLASRFSIMPTMKCRGSTVVPPIYSIEMDAATFRELSSNKWHIGVPTSVSSGGDISKDSLVVIIQHPHA